jgi:hypothetical protein
MTRFILIKDVDNTQHYVNVHQITRVTKRIFKASQTIKVYVCFSDGQASIIADEPFDDIVTKIQVAMA